MKIKMKIKWICHSIMKVSTMGKNLELEKDCARAINSLIYRQEPIKSQMKVTDRSATTKILWNSLTIRKKMSAVIAIK
jgi:hypothetical protein